MVQQALKIGLIVAGLGLVVQEVNAFDCGGMGAGCGGGVGSSSSSYGCSGYGGSGYGGSTYIGSGYTGWSYGGGASGYGGRTYIGRGYAGGGLSSSSRESSSQVARSSVPPVVSGSQATSNSVLLTVRVPADAKLFINDRPTKITGELRHFSTSRQQPGRIYNYRVRAEFVDDGKPASEEKTVELTNGQTVSLAFGAASKVPVADIATAAQR